MQKIDNRIKVCIRARPLFQNETKESFDYSPTMISLKVPISKTQSSFSFDHVFNAACQTEEVFIHSARHILDNAVEGYNGTIFAYGQTTSGKTHTMVGNQNGIIPRSLDYLYRKFQSFDGTEFKVWVSYLEIYNEVINDLLNTGSINLKIREDPVEGYFVSGLKQIPCHSLSEALKVLETGEKQRSYRATNIHEHSSRSHSVFKLLIESKQMEGVDTDEENHLHLKGTVKFSVVNLVDLAGSERMSEAGDSNETSYINKSLFILTNVINKLAENPNGHIPYRDSKLTRILCNSLGGNAVTSIICTIAPDISQLQLSLSTLRFALRAKCIKNRPVVNEVIDDSALIVTYKSKISKLEIQMASIVASKDQEIQMLKSKLSNKAESQKEQIVEYVNLSDLGYSEKYKELQKNFNRQIELKNNLLDQITELKKIGTIGFDVQRSIFEGKNDCTSISTWDEECKKLRNSYLIEMAGFDKRYYKLIENLFENFKNTNKRPSVTRQTPRPVSKSLTTRKSAQVPVNHYNIRKPGTKVINTSSTRDRSKINSPSIKKHPSLSRELNVSPSPSPFRLVCEDITKPEQNETFVKEAHNKSSNDFFNESSINELGLKFNPPPFFTLPEVSGQGIELELVQNNNVLLFGSNKDGSCSGEKFDSLPVYHNPSNEYVEVVCGYYHTAFLNSQGVLFTVGKGTCGQLGTGNIENTHIITPVTHPLFQVPVQIVVCGWQHTLCVSMGSLYAWGFNGEGQLGLGDYYDRSWPVRIERITDPCFIAAGFGHSGCVCNNGSTYFWGSNPDGRLFKAPIQLRHQAYKTENLPHLIDIKSVQIACGTTHSLILTNTGEVCSAGSTQHGQLGMGINYLTHSKYVKLLIFAKGSALKIGCGDYFSAVLTKENDLYTFGKGSFGRLGLGKTRDTLEPELVKKCKFVDFSCGGRHMAALDSNGTLYAWGYGFYHQLGDLNQEDYNEPTVIDLTTATGKWPKKVSCGYIHTGVITL